MGQLHPDAVVVCDESATAELKVKTVKYFKEQCKQNGLKGYSRKTRKGLIRMLMPL